MDRGNYLYLHYKIVIGSLPQFSFPSEDFLCCVELTASPECLHFLTHVRSILFGHEIVLLIAVHPLPQSVI